LEQGGGAEVNTDEQGIAIFEGADPCPLPTSAVTVTDLISHITNLK